MSLSQCLKTSLMTAGSRDRLISTSVSIQISRPSQSTWTLKIYTCCKWFFELKHLPVQQEFCYIFITSKLFLRFQQIPSVNLSLDVDPWFGPLQLPFLLCLLSGFIRLIFFRWHGVKIASNTRFVLLLGQLVSLVMLQSLAPQDWPTFPLHCTTCFGAELCACVSHWSLQKFKILSAAANANLARFIN